MRIGRWIAVALVTMLATGVNAQNNIVGPPVMVFNGDPPNNWDYTWPFADDNTTQEIYLPVEVEDASTLKVRFRKDANVATPVQTLYIYLESEGPYFECWLNSPVNICYLVKSALNSTGTQAHYYLLNSNEPGTPGGNLAGHADKFDAGPAMGYGSEHYIRVSYQGDIAWLMPEFLLLGGGGSGGAGGVDADDWDYWFDSESGLHLQTFAGLDRWFGNQTLPGEMQTVLETLEEIRDYVATSTGSANYEIEFDLDDLALPDYEEDFQILQRKEDLIDLFPELGVPEAYTDDTEAPELRFDLPLDDWFGNLSSSYTSVTPSMSNLTVAIQTDPFDDIRTPLHAICYMLLSLWAGLRVFNEFKKR